jgi:hypothetical protein
MNTAKPLGFFAAGFLAVLLAGCFNPISVVHPNAADNSLAEPFSVDILIGKDTASRSVAGPDTNRIKADIRNIIQLIVTDDSGNIIAFDEARRGSDTEAAAELRIESLPFGQKYHFLLLMGHWERNYGAESGGNYVYKETVPPTLLAAGLKEQTVIGSGKITVTMWPLVVDTVFTSGERTAAPVITSGNPKEVSLLPVNWNVTWTIKRGLSGNGLADLIKAQKIAAPSAGETLLLKSPPQTVVWQGTGNGTWSSITLTGNVITRSIKAYTNGFAKIGTRGSVNFKMEYIPFNLAGTGGTNPWAGLDARSAFDLSGNKVPVWIIRNGVNDEAQNAATNFTAFHNIGNPGMRDANGNGAVRFGMAAKTPLDGSTLEVRDGVFVGPSNSTTPEITFTTDGYEGNAEVYYAVVFKEDNPPEISDYKQLNDTVPKGNQREEIQLGAAQVGKDCDIYVIAYKDGEVSAPLIINTAKGGGGIDWIWGN